MIFTEELISYIILMIQGHFQGHFQDRKVNLKVNITR